MYPNRVILQYTDENLTYVPEPVIGLPPPVSRPLYFVLRDWERADFTGTITRPNLPMVFRCGELDNSSNGHYSDLNSEWQFFLMDLLSLSYYGKPHTKLTKLERAYMAKRTTAVYASARAFSNNKGLDLFRNYLLGERLTEGLPSIYTLVCGGASLAGEKKINTKGVSMLKVDYFDGNGSPPPIETININTDPRIFFATTITSTIKNEGYAVYRFPNLDGKDVPIPIIASQPIYYPLAYTKLLIDGKKGYPYYP